MSTLSSILPPVNVSTASGTLPVSNGGTGATTLTANNVLLGNGTSAIQAVAPSTNGNVLVSNGTTWVSQTPADTAFHQRRTSRPATSAASADYRTRRLTHAYNY